MESEVQKYTKEVLDASGKLPHCDMYVLHAPGTCDYCDMVPELQEYRIENGINFTNENDPQLGPCPSWDMRPQSVIERWHGNIPHKDVGKLA